MNEAIDKVRAFAVSGLDYITKPFQFEEVLARIKTHLFLRKMRVELEE
ncbi:MAG: response regulator transcription factor [Proteobacteria bacterium]|nr:response regulator transcription factor [Pseudomonadota bacterium]